MKSNNLGNFFTLVGFFLTIGQSCLCNEGDVLLKIHYNDGGDPVMKKVFSIFKDRDVTFARTATFDVYQRGGVDVLSIVKRATSGLSPHQASGEILEMVGYALACAAPVQQQDQNEEAPHAVLYLGHYLDHPLPEARTLYASEESNIKVLCDFIRSHLELPAVKYADDVMIRSVGFMECIQKDRLNQFPEKAILHLRTSVPPETIRGLGALQPSYISGTSFAVNKQLIITAAHNLYYETVHNRRYIAADSISCSIEWWGNNSKRSVRPIFLSMPKLYHDHISKINHLRQYHGRGSDCRGGKSCPIKDGFNVEHRYYNDVALLFFKEPLLSTEDTICMGVHDDKSEASFFGYPGRGPQGYNYIPTTFLNENERIINTTSFLNKMKVTQKGAPFPLNFLNFHQKPYPGMSGGPIIIKVGDSWNAIGSIIYKARDESESHGYRFNEKFLDHVKDIGKLWNNITFQNVLHKDYCEAFMEKLESAGLTTPMYINSGEWMGDSFVKGLIDHLEGREE